MGGGLAGLSLAIQLKQKHPSLPVTVLEKNAHPVAQSTHKVGESTVEIGAHYFAQILGLKDHLENEQLKKFGFRFFFSDGKHTIDDVTELGGSQKMYKAAYQIDRGIFENFLGQTALSLGVQFLHGATIKGFHVAGEAVGKAEPAGDSQRISDGMHQVNFEHGGKNQTLDSDWLIDATGRAGLIKRKLKLALPNAHDANAVWFRVNHKIDVNAWSDNQAWLDRCNPPNRWLSTNHLVGNGYWVWLIPLASGSHSVGIVCDAKTHPLEQMNTFDKALSWIEKHQPLLHANLTARQDSLQDFAYFKQFSYGCSRVYSGQNRWALTGEAGVFLDPFYSPGSDFIAIGNCNITQLITLDLQGQRIGASAELFERIFLNFYKNMLPIYVNQYKLFADPEIMPLKLSWDYAFYWSLMCQIFMQNRLTDLPIMFAISPILERAQELNLKMQALFSSWGDLNTLKNHPIMLDQCKVAWLFELNRALLDQWESVEFVENIKKAEQLLEILAAQIAQYAKNGTPLLNIQSIENSLKVSTVDPFSKQHTDMLFGNMQGY